MEVKAKTTKIRMPARKLRLIADMLRGRDVASALEGLRNLDKRGAEPFRKLVKQALANATHNFGLSSKDLRIDQVLVEAGPTYKRWRAVSRGQAHSVKKRSSQLTMTVKGEKDGPKN